MLAKFNLKVLYLPPCKREVCHFNKANNDHIKKEISDFNGRGRLQI